MREQADDVRAWHYITRNVKSSVPGSVLVVDTETNGTQLDDKPNVWSHKLKLWCGRHCRIEGGKVTREVSKVGITQSHFWDWVDDLLNERRPLWLFAHNIGFDLTILGFWKLLETGHFMLSQTIQVNSSDATRAREAHWSGTAVIDDPPTIFKVRRGQTNRVLICVDTCNYFRTSVRQMGIDVGVPKYKMPADKDDIEELADYCMRDVDIVYKVITAYIKLVKRYDLGVFRYTSPAQAFSAYRHRFMSHRILVHGNKLALQLEREAYYGGRCEAFYVGSVSCGYEDVQEYFNLHPQAIRPVRKGPIYVLDFKSFYPFVMAVQAYPTKILGCVPMPAIAAVDALPNDCGVIARCRVKSFHETYPVHRQGRTYNARGLFTTAICGPEYQRCRRNDSIVGLGLVAWYEMNPIFDDYVKFFWTLRQTYEEKDNKTFALLCKVMLNSLYGKFGQRNHEWVDDLKTFPPFPFGVWAECDAETRRSSVYRSIAWLTQRQRKGGESADSCPAIAAFVTAYGRELLLEHIEVAGQNNVLYCDTDSLHVTGEGYHRLWLAGRIADKELGKLRLVQQVSEAEYRGLKDYTLDGTHVIAGIKYNATELERGVFRQAEFQRLQSILASVPTDRVLIEDVTVDRTEHLRTGQLLPDGSVLPVTLDE